MPRNSNGDYSLPAGNPVVTGTVISSTWANTTLSDIATAMTGSLARNGDGGMTGQFKADSGTVGSPGQSWSSETTSGWYRHAAGDFRFAIGGSAVVTITSAGISAGSLPTNIAYKDAANVFTAAQTITIAGDNTLNIINSAASVTAFIGAGGAEGWTGTVTSHPFQIYTNNALRGIVSAAGNWTINAPGSGTSLTINVLSGGDARLIGSDLVQFYTISTGNVIAALKSIDSVTSGWVGTESNHPFRIASNNSTRILVSSAGNVSINVPSSGISLTVPDQKWEDSGIALQAYLSGGAGNFGTTTNHVLSLLTNNTVRVSIGTSGGVQVGSPTGGDLGAGTINVSGDLAINGETVAYRNLIERIVSGSSNTAASDNGKAIEYNGTGGHTFTADSDIAVNGVLVIMNGGSAALTLSASGTLYWFGGAGSLPTGNRTLAVGGIVTLYSRGSGDYYVWGTGIS